MKKLNIWILNHYAISPKSIGGTRHYDLAKELVRRGHTVRIFASSFNHFTKEETTVYEKGISKEEDFNNVKFTWIKTPSYQKSVKRVLNIITFTYRLNKVLANYIKHEKPDLIIGSSVHPLTPLVGLNKAKKVKSLFYFEERDLWPQTFIDFGMLSEKNILTRLLLKIETYLYKESDRTIFLFDKAHKYAFTKGLAKGKEVLIPNGYSIQRLNDSIKFKEINEMLSYYKGKKLCLYVGSMGEANHMLPLLELTQTMKQEKEYHFLFVGQGPLKKSLSEYIEHNHLTNVTFIDPVPKEQIPDLLRHADYGMISIKDSPLYKWGFSMNKIYDYLSVGLPVLMYSSLDSIGNLEQSNAIINFKTTEEMKAFLLNPSKIDREAIQKFAMEHYSWEVLSNKLLEIVEEDIVRK
ncbi:glycosyltransferase WbuB [Sporosarcina sp. NCCP-2222]|uniref:glycosyltransferase family 4 protein n=1 Tax=Sporosarcina sp. NCCP-2222 TaxID=2935073 RepID=UPI002082601C|nr:glycosyltransferase family 4 protein [Sporosarcina sp. NCCP-2222]GKV57396.1 glycosyltransferase WbuB [Sporosarcina sp. NCCP-2222]